MKLKSVLFTSTLLLLYSYPLAFAQSPSPSPTPSTIRDSVKQKVDEELASIKQSVAKRAFVGTVSAKSDGTVTITNLQNQSRQTTLTADAVIKLSGGKDGTPADIKQGDFVIAMGEVDSQNHMTVKRFVVTTKPQTEKRLSLSGSVTKASLASLSVESTDKKTYTIKLQSASKYTGTTKASAVKVGSKIIVLGTATSDTDVTAKIIHLFP